MTSGGSSSRRASGFELHDGVDVLEQEWDALAERTGASPFLRPGWLGPWYRAFGRGRPLVAALRRGSELVAVAAFEARRGALRSAANWHTPEYDVVADSRESAQQLAEQILARRPRRLELRFLNGQGLAFPAFGEAAAAARYRLLTRPLEQSPYVAVSGEWEEYTRTLSQSMLRELSRRQRRLAAEVGPVSVSGGNGLGHLAEDLETGFRVEASGWKGRAGTAILSRPETRTFYTDVARWAADRGYLRLSFLSAADRPIAFQLDIESHGVLYHLKPGYDEAYARFRPGKLLTRDVVRGAFERGLRSYEFLGDAELHKLEWTSSVRERLLLQGFAPSLTGIAELAAFRYGRPFATQALRVYRRARGRTR